VVIYEIICDTKRIACYVVDEVVSLYVEFGKRIKNCLTRFCNKYNYRILEGMIGRIFIKLDINIIQLPNNDNTNVPYMQTP